jgi:hypothetical protein
VGPVEVRSCAPSLGSRLLAAAKVQLVATCACVDGFMERSELAAIDGWVEDTADTPEPMTSGEELEASFSQ